MKRQRVAISFLVSLVLTVVAPAQTAQSYVPNDPGTRANMAAVNAAGLPVGWAKINALRAAGKRKVRVAVCDTGIDERHPDLFGKVIEHHNKTSDVIDPLNMDNNGHGTQQASIIAGTGDNGQGIAGVVYNPDPSQLNLGPDIELLDYKVLNSNGEFSSDVPLTESFKDIKSKIVSGFEIDIVNCSLTTSGSPELKQATDELIAAGAIVLPRDPETPEGKLSLRISDRFRQAIQVSFRCLVWTGINSYPMPTSAPRLVPKA